MAEAFCAGVGVGLDVLPVCPLAVPPVELGALGSLGPLGSLVCGGTLGVPPVDPPPEFAGDVADGEVVVPAVLLELLVDDGAGLLVPEPPGAVLADGLFEEPAGAVAPADVPEVPLPDVPPPEVPVVGDVPPLPGAEAVADGGGTTG